MKAHWQSHCGSAAAAVIAALAPDLADGPEGAHCHAFQEGALVHVHIDAPDLSTLRAALTSSIRLLDAALGAASDNA